MNWFADGAEKMAKHPRHEKEALTYLLTLRKTFFEHSMCIYFFAHQRIRLFKSSKKQIQLLDGETLLPALWVNYNYYLYTKISYFYKKNHLFIAVQMHFLFKKS